MGLKLLKFLLEITGKCGNGIQGKKTLCWSEVGGKKEERKKRGTKTQHETGSGLGSQC